MRASFVTRINWITAGVKLVDDLETFMGAGAG